MAVTATIGGRVMPVEAATLSIQRSVGQRALAEFDLFIHDLDTFTRPTRGESVSLTTPRGTGQDRIFGGQILSSAISLTRTGTVGVCRVTCTGYAARLDDLLIKQRYLTPHNATAAAVMLDLLTRFAGGSGITVDAANLIATNMPGSLVRLRLALGRAHGRRGRRERRLVCRCVWGLLCAPPRGPAPVHRPARRAGRCAGVGCGDPPRRGQRRVLARDDRRPGRLARWEISSSTGPPQCRPGDRLARGRGRRHAVCRKHHADG